MSEYTWTPVARELPPENLTVELCNPAWQDEKVWPGFYKDGVWHTGEGMWLNSPADSGLNDAEPTHWKHRPSLPVTDGVVKIVYVMTSRPGNSAVQTRVEFEPDLGSADDSAAGRLFIEMMKLLATVVRDGSKTEEAR